MSNEAHYHKNDRLSKHKYWEGNGRLSLKSWEADATKILGNGRCPVARLISFVGPHLGEYLHMFYFVGGAPRTGKSILGQQIATKLNIGWISTDILVEMLRVKNEDGIKTEWNAAPEAISNDAEWFFPYLERFVWRLTSHTENYLIEGVDFLPVHINKLSNQYAVKSVFLGNSNMTLDRFDHFPGHTHGYVNLPEDVRQQYVNDIPHWSDYVRQEAIHFNYPYVDMYDDFSSRLVEAETLLTS